jgi:uncharacterized BrkB/YihY/UPF0761 family membrane protein
MPTIRIGIPLVLIGIFIIYLLYLVITKAEPKKIKQVLLPGMFFTSVWLLIYIFVFK